MENFLSERECKLLSIVNYFQSRNIYADYSNLEHRLKEKIPSMIGCVKETLTELLDKGIIIYLEDISAYKITETGQKFADELQKDSYLTKCFYEEYYKRAEISRAHGEFCERVYGRNFCQHGMMSMEQLDEIIKQAEPLKDRKVLELGCGNGHITEYISDNTQWSILGIDIAENAISEAQSRTIEKREKLNFEVKSMDNLDYEKESFDAVISIDTLYFVKSMEGTLEDMMRILRPDGSVYIFYHVPPFEEEEKRKSPERNSDLGQLLKKMGLSYRVKDFTNENRQHWELKRKVLAELKDKFEEEGNMFLYNNRMNESESNMIDFYRYLYIINK
jgi:ubiquinone/menaquinone biosynthesis C-methylase UbiE